MLEPVVGAERLDDIAIAERRLRRTLAAKITPPPTGWRGDTATAAAERPLAATEQRPQATEGGDKPGDKRSSPAARARRQNPPQTYPTPTLSCRQFLSGLHRVLQPRTYLEIGVSNGRSLALSRVPSIGVDPAFKVTAPIACDVQLVRATSDDFFATSDAVAHFGGTPVDFAFIDGLHLAEFAYRDFMNVERLCSTSSVVVLDDMLPRSDEEAARVQIRGGWAGDVFKVVEILRQRRPDLVVMPVNTRPTGVVVVVGLDPHSAVLGDIYDEVLEALESPDPQHVPDHVINRKGAADARALLDLPVWSELRRLRDGADSHAVAKAIAELSAT